MSTGSRFVHALLGKKKPKPKTAAISSVFCKRVGQGSLGTVAGTAPVGHRDAGLISGISNPRSFASLTWGCSVAWGRGRSTVAGVVPTWLFDPVQARSHAECEERDRSRLLRPPPETVSVQSAQGLLPVSALSSPRAEKPWDLHLVVQQLSPFTSRYEKRVFSAAEQTARGVFATKTPVSACSCAGG